MTARPVFSLPSCDRSGRLTPGGMRVLRHLADGSTAAEVARRLFVSERTVHDHIHRSYRALGVHSLQAALLAAGIIKIVEVEQ